MAQQENLFAEKNYIFSQGDRISYIFEMYVWELKNLSFQNDESEGRNVATWLVLLLSFHVKAI